MTQPDYNLSVVFQPRCRACKWIGTHWEMIADAWEESGEHCETEQHIRNMERQ